MSMDEVVTLIQDHRRSRDAYVPPKKPSKPKAEKVARATKTPSTRKPRTKKAEITKAQAARLLELLSKGKLL